MKVWKVVLFVSFVFATAIAQQGQPLQTDDSVGTTASQITVNSEPPGTLVRILSPVANQRLGTTYVDVTYELVKPGMSGGTPSFQVQLDGRAPVSTEDTQCTFTGLNLGEHAVVVQLVDANGTPITGGRSNVIFSVVSSRGQSLPHR